jgi:ATP phosphoribosyltransferase regulatory subunit
MQIGAELYGHSGIESDYEIICLMLETLALSSLQNVHLDLGHVGIYRALVAQAELSSQQETQLFDVLQRKAGSELKELLQGFSIDERFKTLFIALSKLNGGRDVLEKAAALLNIGNESVSKALADLQNIADKLRRDFPLLPVSFDLAELRGYHYHTGLVFAAFIPALGREIARGGRYDNIGEIFGRARAATGFSADLKQLVSLSTNTTDQASTPVILAPYAEDADLLLTIRDLRAEGATVIQYLPNQVGNAGDLRCTATLEKQDQRWLVKPLA